MRKQLVRPFNIVSLGNVILLTTRRNIPIGVTEDNHRFHFFLSHQNYPETPGRLYNNFKEYKKIQIDLCVNKASLARSINLIATSIVDKATSEHKTSYQQQHACDITNDYLPSTTLQIVYKLPNTAFKLYGSTEGRTVKKFTLLEHVYLVNLKVNRLCINYFVIKYRIFVHYIW